MEFGKRKNCERNGDFGNGYGNGGKGADLSREVRHKRPPGRMPNFLRQCLENQGNIQHAYQDLGSTRHLVDAQQKSNTLQVAPAKASGHYTKHIRPEQLQHWAPSTIPLRTLGNRIPCKDAIAFEPLHVHSQRPNDMATRPVCSVQTKGRSVGQRSKRGIDQTSEAPVKKIPRQRKPVPKQALIQIGNFRAITGQKPKSLTGLASKKNTVQGNGDLKLSASRSISKAGESKSKKGRDYTKTKFLVATRSSSRASDVESTLSESSATRTVSVDMSDGDDGMVISGARDALDVCRREMYVREGRRNICTCDSCLPVSMDTDDTTAPAPVPNKKKPLRRKRTVNHFQEAFKYAYQKPALAKAWLHVNAQAPQETYNGKPPNLKMLKFFFPQNCSTTGTLRFRTFSRNDTCELIKPYQKIVVIGDSNMRNVYKDLVRVTETEDLLTERQSRNKAEHVFCNDKLIYRSHTTAGTDFEEVRQYTGDNICIEFYFITKIYSMSLESKILSQFAGEKRPNLVIFNSAMWDLTRYGEYWNEESKLTQPPQEYTKNAELALARIYQIFRKDRSCDRRPDIIYLSTFPILNQRHFGLLHNSVEQDFFRNKPRLDLDWTNTFMRNLCHSYEVNYVDVTWYLRQMLAERNADGIHFSPKAHRLVSYLILTSLEKLHSINGKAAFRQSTAVNYCDEVTTKIFDNEGFDPNYEVRFSDSESDEPIHKIDGAAALGKTDRSDSTEKPVEDSETRDSAKKVDPNSAAAETEEDLDLELELWRAELEAGEKSKLRSFSDETDSDRIPEHDWYTVKFRNDAGKRINLLSKLDSLSSGKQFQVGKKLYRQDIEKIKRKQNVKLPEPSLRNVTKRPRNSVLGLPKCPKFKYSRHKHIALPKPPSFANEPRDDGQASTDAQNLMA